jgi:hypothetical protein
VAARVDDHHRHLIDSCQSCKEVKRIFAVRLCRTCWKKNRPLIQCGCCQRSRPKYATKFGVQLCERCVDTQYVPSDEKCSVCETAYGWLTPSSICPNCLSIRAHGDAVRQCWRCRRKKKVQSFGLCQNCYHNTRRFLTTQIETLSM